MVADVKAKPIAKKEESFYQSGFCGIGNHENSKNLSPSGLLLTACPVGGRFATFGLAGRQLEDGLCTCFCHDMSREMEELSGVKFPARNSVRDSSPLSGLGLLRVPGYGTASDEATGSVDPSRPTVAAPSGVTFTATPSGRAARGLLEESVRHFVCQQVKAAGDEMIAMLGLTPNTLGLMIDSEDPPSSGAIYAVLKRWEKLALVDLAETPFRFVRFTERGKRDLMR